MSGSPMRYCANLGHLQDEESGFLYIRARYYDSGSGRFLSEDTAMDRMNWYAYCINDPVNQRDESGCNVMGEINLLLLRVLQDLSKASTRDRVRRIGNAAIRSMIYLRDTQRSQEADCIAMAELAEAAGNAEAAENFLAAAGRHGALAVAADLAIIQIRAMMFIAEMTFDIG